MKFKNTIAKLMLGAFLIGCSGHHNITRAFITKEEADGITLYMDYVERKNKDKLKQKLIDCAIKNYKSIDPDFDEKSDYGTFVVDLFRQIPIVYRKTTIPNYWTLPLGFNLDACFYTPFVQVVGELKVVDLGVRFNCVDFFEIIWRKYYNLSGRPAALFVFASQTISTGLRNDTLEREYHLKSLSTPSSEISSQISNLGIDRNTLIFIERFTKAYCKWLGIDAAKTFASVANQGKPA